MTTTDEQLAMAGELLIRAAAALSKIPPAERDARGAQCAELERAIHDGLAAAAALAPQVADSLRKHGKAPQLDLFWRVAGRQGSLLGTASAAGVATPAHG